MESLLISYEKFRETECFDAFEQTVYDFLRNEVDMLISHHRNLDRVNSLFSFALCSPSGVQLRHLALEIIVKYADDLSNRYVLVSKLLILKPLLHGFRHWPEKDLCTEALKAFHICTLELHTLPHKPENDILICGARQAISVLKSSQNKGNIQIALGILVNLSRIQSIIHKALQNRDDFDLLRKLLLRSMNDESSSQIELVLSMNIIFQLWGIQDKFFDGQNFQTSVQVLFNIFLNGECSTESLYAGDMLIQFCMDQTSFRRIISHPSLRQALCEIIKQLSAKNSKLVYKFLGFLTCLLKNDAELCAYIRSQFFKPGSGDEGIGILADTIGHLMQSKNHFLAASMSDFVFQMESSFSKSPFVVKLNNFVDYNATLLQLLAVITQSLTPNLEENEDTSAFVCRKRVTMRCASLVVQRSSQICSSLDSESVDTSADYVARLACVVQSIARHAIESNSQLSVFMTQNCSNGEICDGNVEHENIMVAKILLTVDALDLLLNCTDFLSTASPIAQKSQENISQLHEDDEETRIDVTQHMAEMRLQEQGLVEGHMRRCGDALQHFLEKPFLAPMLALAVVVGDDRPNDTFGCRSATLRLLRIAFNLHNFSIMGFLETLNKILPPGNKSLDEYLTTRLLKQNASDNGYLEFTSEWLASSYPYSINANTAHHQNKTGGFLSRQSSETTLNKLCAAVDNSTLSFATISGSEAMNIYRRKIELLQSREAVLEADAAAKTEALRTADAISEHFRTRTISAESEVSRLLDLQITALIDAEKCQTQLSAIQQKMILVEKENERLSAELASKQEECEAVQSARLNAQSKLTAMREQNRAMDSTIDNFRRQLDEAKQVIQQKDSEIQKFSHMTRLINELTGSRVAPPT